MTKMTLYQNPSITPVDSCQKHQKNFSFLGAYYQKIKKLKNDRTPKCEGYQKEENT